MIAKRIKELIIYAKKALFLDEDDAVYFENLLLGHFGCLEADEGEIDVPAIEALASPDVLVEALEEDLINESGMDKATAEIEAVYALGLLTPMPSDVQSAFDALKEASPEEALEYLYDLSVKNYYVRKTMIDKNIEFTASFPEGSSLEITINLSKPEKNNADIAKLVHAKKSGYPACALCKENMGYLGHASHPARTNLRFVKLLLDGEVWYLQYSPYGYFDRHCILFFERHEPMEVSRRIFSKLLGFVDAFPCFFMGSNADLPIVGGSILNHEHFQGGRHLLPVMVAPMRRDIATRDGVLISEVDFYANAIRLKGKDKVKVLDIAEKILSSWRGYDDPENHIVHATGDTAHNTITALARKEGEEFLLYLLLRNNRTSEEYPDGIFHAHPEYFPIKKEGIGLIEAGGRFILPARLKRQGKEVEDVIKDGLTPEQALERYPDIEPFFPMIEKMSSTGESLQDYLADVCQNILRNVAVFKDDAAGKAGFDRFLEVCLS